MGLYSAGLVTGGIVSSEIWGLIFGRTYFWRGLLSEFYAIKFLMINIIQQCPGLITAYENCETSQGYENTIMRSRKGFNKI